MIEIKAVHPFEKAGLGKAPFRFIGMEHRTHRACPGAPLQPGGSCDYCGTGISYFCWIDDAQGKRFKVGSDCVRKTGDQKLKEDIAQAKRNTPEAIEARDRKRAAKIQAQEEKARIARENGERFLRETKGLQEAFEVGAAHLDHPKHRDNAFILADMHAKLRKYGSLSEKQVSFALSLAERITKVWDEETKVAAPTGRVQIEGKVIKVAERESQFGTAYKMILKVQAEGGIFLVWSTIPSSILSTVKLVRDAYRPYRAIEELKGKTIRMTATLEHGRDEYFAFAKRPSKAEVV